HKADETGVLDDVDPEGEGPTWKRNFSKKKTDDDRSQERKSALEEAFNACNMGGNVTLENIIEYMDLSEKTVRRYAKEHGGYWIDDGEIGRKSND
ncbi:MAG: hypothetical protein RR619_02805, partial [Raoultibacter sp.]